MRPQHVQSTTQQTLDRQREPPFRLQPATPTTFDLNIGSDRMRIQPNPKQDSFQLNHHHHNQRMAASLANRVSGDPTMATTAAAAAAAATTEAASSNIDLLLLDQSTPNLGTNNYNPLTTTLLPAPMNERRQDLLYPSAASNVDSLATRQGGSLAPPPAFNAINGFPFADPTGELNGVPSICYSPLALLMVILVTVIITVAVCFCTHILIKYLSRHQFDLIENSKHFSSKHSAGLHGGRHSGPQWAPQTLGAAATSTRPAEEKRPGCLSVFAAPDEHQHQHPNQHQQRLGRPLEYGCAFDNPYFDEARRANGGGLLAAATSSSGGEHRQPAARNDEAGSQQLNFIENHISRLHSRQVTSSVNELSSTGNPTPEEELRAANVVDLTSAEQRARIIANPREGDLVAVDLTGHDFIGLGFEVCGNPSEGVFVRSVLARGPAQESGCVEPGDRIKCLNISFEQVTLEDACDILNCAAPYKMRLLLEKRIAPASLLSRMRSPAPIVIGSVDSVPFQASAGSRHQLVQRGADHQLGPLGLTRAYLRRIGRFVWPASMQQAADERATRPPTLDCGPANCGHQGLRAGHQTPASNSSERHLLSPVYLGSAAARSHHLATRSTPTEQPDELGQGGHVNGGFGDEATRDNERREIASHPHQAHYARSSVPNGSVGSVPAASVLTREASLDYRSKNAAHRLHGPPLGTTSNAMREIDLAHQSEGQLEVGYNHSHNYSHSHSHRRLSVAGGATSRKVDSARQVDAHLQQTQSQPEIATRNAADERAQIAMSPVSPVPVTPAETTASNDHISRPPRAPLGNSTSTPSMNLLPDLQQQQQQQQQPAVWRPSSSRRKRAGVVRNNSVKEEPEDAVAPEASSTRDGA